MKIVLKRRGFFGRLINTPKCFYQIYKIIRKHNGILKSLKASFLINRSNLKPL